MNYRNPIVATLSFTFVAANAFVYLFLMIAIVPYWQELSGTEVQQWFSGPFSRFAHLMVPVHLLAISTTVAACWLHRGEGRTRRLWYIALGTLLISQGFNFTLYGGVLNPSLAAPELAASETLNVLDDWDLYHKVRTLFVCLSLACLGVVSVRSRASPLNQV